MSLEYWDVFWSSYRDALLWTARVDSEEGGSLLDDDLDSLSYWYWEEVEKGLDRRELREIAQDAEGFFGEASALVVWDDDTASQAGHDFHLTRNGHGAGFWDGDWPEELGDKLSELAGSYGTLELLGTLDSEGDIRDVYVCN